MRQEIPEGFRFSPMWVIWAIDYAIPLIEARKAWEEYIDGLE